MADLKRATVYFDPSLHKALRVKAAHTDGSLSDLVNAATIGAGQCPYGPDHDMA